MGSTYCSERSCELKRPWVPETEGGRNSPAYMGAVRKTQGEDQLGEEQQVNIDCESDSNSCTKYLNMAICNENKTKPRPPLPYLLISL